MEWAVSIVVLAPLAVYVCVCLADARSYAARMEHQRQRRDGLKLLGVRSTTIPDGLVVATADARRTPKVTERSGRDRA